MIPLPKTFTKKGWDFEVVHRQGDIAMVRKSKQGLTRLIESWEVVKIQKHRERTVDGRVLAASESMPSDESWGNYGWTYLTREEAWKAYLEKCPTVPE